MENKLANLVDLLTLLEENGIHAYIFGGWAEELWGLTPPRFHQEIDLLYLADNFERVDSFLLDCDCASEVAAKRFAHKRAFEWEGVLVEFILARREGERTITRFFRGEASLAWPADTFDFSLEVEKRLVPVVSPAGLSLYRTNHAAVQAAYQETLRGK